VRQFADMIIEIKRWQGVMEIITGKKIDDLLNSTIACLLVDAKTKAQANRMLEVAKKIGEIFLYLKNERLQLYINIL
jgi:hypothetical protein